MGVRLATRGRGYGSLEVYADGPSAFSYSDEDAAETLAAHATAASISQHENTRLATAAGAGLVQRDSNSQSTFD
jgi:hypothetical protein